MKIAFIYDAVYPWIKGGAEKRIYEVEGLPRSMRLTGIGWVVV